MRWLADLRRWAEEGIDFVQLREKQMKLGELLILARAGQQWLQHLQGNPVPRILVNGRPDLAAAARLDGVHLTSRPGELQPEQVRAVFRASGLPQCTVSVSCHTLEDVANARERGADLILFGPVFEKRVAGQLFSSGTGKCLLKEAASVAHPVAVLALGGVTTETADECLKAGAAGVAAIRLFGAACL